MNDLKQTACDMIDRHRDAIIGLAEQVWARPETGFREYETSRLVARLLKDSGLACREGLALTGVRAELRGAQAGPTMALLAEMDGIILPSHPSGVLHRHGRRDPDHAGHPSGPGRRGRQRPCDGFPHS